MDTLKSILKILFGIIILVLGIWVIITWSNAVWMVIKAAIAMIVCLIGLAFIIIGSSDIKNE